MQKTSLLVIEPYRLGADTGVPMNTELLQAVLPPSDAPPATDFGSLAEPGEILERAEALGIPWRRLLLQEIEAEQTLRRYLADVSRSVPLPDATTILPLSFLQSWRVRDRIETLACQAKAGAVRGAIRQLRMVFRRLVGTGDRDQAALGQHLWFAHQRVLLLQRARRAAGRSEGSMAERLAFVCATTHCSYDDAAWAIGQADAPRSGRRYEAAIRKVRDEGFRIPRAESEARSLAELRRAVSASAGSRRRRDGRPSPNPNSPIGLQEVVRGSRS